jgi:hypothetical protein
MKPILEGNKLDQRLERLLDQFEREVEPYDKWSGIALFATPMGIMISIFLPVLLLQSIGQTNPYVAITSGSVLYWIVGGILATAGLAKLPILYVDHKKHEISNMKYRPLAGVCMCDLSQLRSHMRKMEKATTIGEHIRHAKLINYYKHQIGWQ